MDEESTESTRLCCRQPVPHRTVRAAWREEGHITVGFSPLLLPSSLSGDGDGDVGVVCVIYRTLLSHYGQKDTIAISGKELRDNAMSSTRRANREIRVSVGWGRFRGLVLQRELLKSG